MKCPRHPVRLYDDFIVAPIKDSLLSQIPDLIDGVPDILEDYLAACTKEMSGRSNTLEAFPEKRLIVILEVVESAGPFVVVVPPPAQSEAFWLPRQQYHSWPSMTDSLSPPSPLPPSVCHHTHLSLTHSCVSVGGMYVCTYARIAKWSTSLPTAVARTVAHTYVS
eukprot:GHVU01039484.1.p2 GENE.GHVU01039484.1~~GHVU01039484.1.p2  ORF type:complete len:165 (-),score=8.53 GHVU01039484.1:11-505(-)